jgi:hypothetical protein
VGIDNGRDPFDPPPMEFDKPSAVAWAYTVLLHASERAENRSSLRLSPFQDTVWRTVHYTPLGTITRNTDYRKVEDCRIASDGGIIQVDKLYFRDEQGNHPLAAVKLG